jgi:hypothetical protein
MPNKIAKKNNIAVHGKGGSTIALIYDDVNDIEVARGVAECSPGDNFNRRLGREIALGRAIKKAGF